MAEVGPSTKLTATTLFVVVAAAVYGDRRLASVESGQERVAYRLDTIEALAREAATRSDLRAFAQDLAEDNPTLKVRKVR